LPFNKLRITPFTGICSFILSFVLYFSLPALLYAGTSPNIPPANWVYEYLESLEARGFITSGLLSTRPFSRLEGARLTGEALNIWNSLPVDRQEGMRSVSLMLKRLEREFQGDQITYGYFKPVDTAYLKYLYNNNTPDHLNTNHNGDILDEGHNVRIGISSGLKLWDTMSFYITPEFREEEDNSEWDLIQAYGILSLYNVELEIGREPMWWGPGVHGGLLLTHNATPFDMIRLTSQKPFLLPWFLSRLGPLKPTLFVTELEKDRDFPHTKLMGMRLDFRPLPSFRFALSRTIMFGGEGRKRLSAGDWIKVLIANDNSEHSLSSGIDNNNIMSVDFSWRVTGLNSSLPLNGAKLYGEIGAEDSSGNGWPKEKAFLAGILVEDPFLLRGTNLRLEWATTAKNTKHQAWYSHGVYTSGYTYKGNIIGHHMGADADDLFARVEHLTGGGIRIGVETDVERKGVHATSTSNRTWVALDLSYPLYETLNIMLGYGRENGDSSSSTIWTKMGWDL